MRRRVARRAELGLRVDLAVDRLVRAQGVGVSIGTAHEIRIRRIVGVRAGLGGGIDRAHVVAEIAADTLLRHCPALRILATSRSRLRVRGERVFRLEPLTGEEAVTLFQRRATEAEAQYQTLATVVLGTPAPGLITGPWRKT